MSDGAWFRLVLRGVGVLVLAHAIPEFLATLGSVGYSASMSPGQPGIGWRYVFFVPGMAAKVAIGFYLLIEPGRLVRYCMRDIGRLCAGCGYDIRAVTTGSCPECGLALAPSKPVSTGAPPGP